MVGFRLTSTFRERLINHILSYYSLTVLPLLSTSWLYKDMQHFLLITKEDILIFCLFLSIQESHFVPKHVWTPLTFTLYEWVNYDSIFIGELYLSYIEKHLSNKMIFLEITTCFGASKESSKCTNDRLNQPIWRVWK